MDELVDILDEHGQPTGRICLKSEAHEKGLLHGVVHVWCYSQKKKLLLQQRGAEKETFPLKWDVSVAGHMASGETPIISAMRETKEEIGVVLQASMLQKIGIHQTEYRHSQKLHDREFVHIFLCCLPELTKLNPQETEVETLKWISLHEFENWLLERPKDFVPKSRELYQMIIRSIRSRIAEKH